MMERKETSKTRPKTKRTDKKKRKLVLTNKRLRIGKVVGSHVIDIGAGKGWIVGHVVGSDDAGLDNRRLTVPLRHSRQKGSRIGLR